MNYKTFCIIIFLIQMAISLLNFWIARVHYLENNRKPIYADILCGVSWLATGLYWLYNAISA